MVCFFHGCFCTIYTFWVLFKDVIVTHRVTISRFTGDRNNVLHLSDSSDEETGLTGNINDVLRHADSSGEEEIGEIDNDSNCGENNNEYQNVNGNLFDDYLVLQLQLAMQSHL
ncbi:uncharacterized protein LOC136080464 [Hydra vulgaris]|uniref:Uncharacterized protein LOC136080464 n=1 Tax=Hydra vulgaris TaxID=6087 RepID=A0ABM4BVH4_HYDVU